jgi:hypothetical protein
MYYELGDSIIRLSVSYKTFVSLSEELPKLIQIIPEILYGIVGIIVLLFIQVSVIYYNRLLVLVCLLKLKAYEASPWALSPFHFLDREEGSVALLLPYK